MRAISVEPPYVRPLRDPHRRRNRHGGFTEFLARIGAAPDPVHPDQERLSQGRRHVWIYLNPESLADIEPHIAQAAVAKLGEFPRSSLVLERSRAR